MHESMSDEALGQLLRSMPEPAVPEMAPLRLPPRPAPLPRIPWHRGEIAMLAAAGAICAAGSLWFAVAGPSALIDFALRVFLVPGGIAWPLLTAVFAGAIGWLAVLLAAPRATA